MRDKLMKIYRDNRFIVVTHVGADGDGTKYQLNYDEGKAKSFIQALKNTDYFKALDDCTDDDLAALVDDLDMGTTTSSNTTVNVWIDSWTHTLNKIAVTAEDGTSSAQMEMRAKFDTKPTISMPQDYMTVDELKAEIEKIQQELSSPLYTNNSTTGTTYNYAY